jgi:uncharacterized protein YqeY
MESDATTTALRRLDAALRRIEAASMRVTPRNSSDMSMNELKSRHEALRCEAEAARDALTLIIANEASEARQ